MSGQNKEFAKSLIDKYRPAQITSEFLYFLKDGVAQDFDLYFPLLSDAGVFAFHDIKDTNQHRSQGCYVFEVWNKLKSKFFTVQFLDNTGGNANWGGIGVLLKDPLLE